jgi:hypothetical protein
VVLAEALLDGEVSAITGKIVKKALEGDSIALRLCLERLMPPSTKSPNSASQSNNLDLQTQYPEGAPRSDDRLSQFKSQAMSQMFAAYEDYLERERLENERSEKERSKKERAEVADETQSSALLEQILSDSLNTALPAEDW